MKIGDQKVQRTLKKQMVRGLLQDKKVPGTSTGTRATAAPGQHPLGLPQGSWERAELTAPSPAKQGLSGPKRDLGASSCREGNKDQVVNPRRLWTPARELGVGPCRALTRTDPSLAGEVGCARGQALPCMERQD